MRTGIRDLVSLSQKLEWEVLLSLGKADSGELKGHIARFEWKFCLGCPEPSLPTLFAEALYLSPPMPAAWPQAGPSQGHQGPRGAYLLPQPGPLPSMMAPRHHAEGPSPFKCAPWAPLEGAAGVFPLHAGRVFPEPGPLARLPHKETV